MTDEVRQQAILALLSCNTIRAAAKKAGVAECTLRRWLKDPDFRRELGEARQLAIAAAAGQLAGAMAAAVKTLKECIARSGKAADRIKAAVGIIDRAMKASELLDLEERVAELEKHALEVKS